MQCPQQDQSNYHGMKKITHVTFSENQTILKLHVLKPAQVTPFVGSQKFPNTDGKRRKIRKSDADQCHQQVKLTAFIQMDFCKLKVKKKTTNQITKHLKAF